MSDQESQVYHYGMATLGEQLESFWKSDVGEYLRVRALSDYNAALAEFQKCNPADTPKVIEIQQKMAISTKFKVWLEEGIAEGLRSKRILEGIDDESPE